MLEGEKIYNKVFSEEGWSSTAEKALASSPALICCVASFKTLCLCNCLYILSCLFNLKDIQKWLYWVQILTLQFFFLLASKKKINTFQSPSIQNYPQLCWERHQSGFLFFLEVPIFCKFQRCILRHLYDLSALINNQNVLFRTYALPSGLFYFYLAAAVLPYKAFAFFLRHHIDLLYETKWSVADLR